MFSIATSFNINNRNASNVKNMKNMFSNETSFNINNWNVSNVFDIKNMFIMKLYLNKIYLVGLLI